MAAQWDRDHGSAANCSADSAPGQRGHPMIGRERTDKSEKNMDSIFDAIESEALL
jgi:hypothetical protein